MLNIGDLVVCHVVASTEFVGKSSIFCIFYTFSFIGNIRDLAWSCTLLDVIFWMPYLKIKLVGVYHENSKCNCNGYRPVALMDLVSVSFGYNCF